MRTRGAHHRADPDTIRAALRVTPGTTVDVGGVDARSTPGFPAGKRAGAHALVRLESELSSLQERLYAQSRAGTASASVLLVLQGMDTSGKGGIVRHVVGSVDPQGVAIHGFKAPTPEELSHDFLWRIRRVLPPPGILGVFDRSHYEDVLVVRVESLVPQEVWQARYDLINAFEAEVAAAGTRLVKVMLRISRSAQAERLVERLDRTDKHWKYNPADLQARARWDDYLTAYSAAVSRCSTEQSPWYVVPADRKWYARLAVASLLVAELREIDPQWPPADVDVDAERRRLAALA